MLAVVYFATLAAAILLLGQGEALAFSSSPMGRGRGRGHILQRKQQQQQQPSSTSLPLHLGDLFDNLSGGKPENKITEEEKDGDMAAKTTDAGHYDEDDPIEKIFGFFFGAKEETPYGMARFGRERFPEQYPAVLDEWAAPVAGDDATMSLLRPLLKNTNLEYRNLRLTYDANQDGWDPIAFHSKVDKQGGAIVLCTTQSGVQCGGYNPKGWVGYGEARGSIAAFLFTLSGTTYANMSTGGAPGIKLRKVGGPGLAQMDEPETGPMFSPDALVIRMNKRDPKLAQSKLGSYYERLPDGTKCLFGDDSSGATQLKELKVYHGVYADGEYVPFTDAEPFALY